MLCVLSTKGMAQSDEWLAIAFEGWRKHLKAGGITPRQRVGWRLWKARSYGVIMYGYTRSERLYRQYGAL